MLVSREDFCKYPFMKEAIEYVKRLDIKTSELSQTVFIPVVERAEQRINEAIVNGIVKITGYDDDEVEILSYPVALLFVATINDSYLRKRYALAEAKRVYRLLGKDNDEILLNIAESLFGWLVRRHAPTVEQPYSFSISFIDYLRNATAFHDARWKLVNRNLNDGKVFLQKYELARLLSEEIGKHVEKNIARASPDVELPILLKKKVEKIKLLLEEKKETIRVKALPQTVIQEAYPPCIQRLYNSLLTGRSMSHIERFTLTSFLLNIGIKSNDLEKIYVSLSDFDQTLTQYQIKHIAGEKGSGTKYKPPSCQTLKTHGLCIGADLICESIRHPLSYYWRKLGLIRIKGAGKNGV